MLRIVLIGPQGSGKGTQAQLLAKKYSIPHIEVGELLREEAEKGTERGLEAKKYWAKGKLVPEKITMNIIKEKLLSSMCKKGFILDGSPRSLEQAERLDEIVEINLVLILDITDHVAVKRLSGRKQCHKCGKIYGVEIIPQKKNICDNCGGKLEVRLDDTPEVIKKRLLVYHEETEPLIEYYRVREDVMYKLDASKKIEKVFKEMCEIIEEKGLA